MLDLVLNDLIGTIYDTVLEPARWPDTIDRIRRYLSFQTAMLGVNLLPSGDAVIKVSSNVPDEFVRAVPLYNQDVLDMWGGIGRFSRLAVEEPVVQSHVLPAGSYENNRYYMGWARPQRLVDQTVLTLEYNRDLFATLCLGRHEDAPPISDDQIEQLRILAPHLRRAVTIGRLLDATASAAASFEATLDASASGVILVGHDMNVVYANERANLMLRAGDPVATLGGRLRLHREVVPGQLETAIRSASNEGQMGRRGMGIPARRGDGSAVVVHVMPLERRTGRPGADLHASAAVFLAEASEEPNLPMEALTLLYGLRPAEARVFELIVAGHSSREIANVLSVAPNTLKTHTQRLFDKLGRHRRADLVQLASELSFPH